MGKAQDTLWRGPFGDAYSQRQTIPLLDTQAFFARALGALRWPSLSSVIEFGANDGHNLVALRAHAAVRAEAKLDGVEINAKAFEKLRSVASSAWHQSVVTWTHPSQWQLVISKGLLIHISPQELLPAYDVLHGASSRYILIAEYFNPTPVAIPYRGQTEALWKRDFGGEMLDRFSDLACLDYGFIWERDAHPQDNVTWWLLEKNQ